MYVTNITDDNCTDNENNNIEILLPLITIVPCGMSLICLISLMVYTLVKPLINKKQKYEYIQLYMYLYLVYLPIYE